MASILTFPRRSAGRLRADETLLAAVAGRRWPVDSVFWLKECAEILSVLQASGGAATPAMTAALAPHLAAFPDRLAFFPQYYRFFLAIQLSAEALDIVPEGGARAMAAWIRDGGWTEAELSDMHRAEARHLLRRAGLGEDAAGDPGLTARLRRFLDRPATFAVPNLTAAYQLTHLVFYLSDYGRRDPGLSAEALAGLRHAGTLAFLDRNADLLAEVCVALVQAGRAAPDAWVDFVTGVAAGFSFGLHSGSMVQDDLHCLLVCDWLFATLDRPGFRYRIPASAGDGALSVHAPPRGAQPARELSVLLMRGGPGRSGDWSRARGPLLAGLTPAARDVVLRAEAADEGFADFYAAFARAARPFAGPGRAGAAAGAGPR